MDALVYEDSPLGTYFEGQAEALDTPPASPAIHTSFAPTGLPSFKERIRSIRRSAHSIQPVSSEQILEQFRYIIVASQLLSDEAPARTVDNDFSERDKNLLNGAIITAASSFVAAYGIHWLRGRKQIFKSASWFELSIFCVAAFCAGVATLLFARRQYAKYVQKAAATSLTRLVNDSHVFDNTAGRALRFVQEVELVSRGYDLTTPLPPITRLEDRQAIRRCQNLRSQLVDTFTTLISLYVESHNVLQHFIVPQDVQRYHDIYEISLVEYSEAIKIANESSEEAKSSLRELRFALRLHAVARKVLLCDLLALRTTAGWARIRQWSAVQSVLHELEDQTISRQQYLNTTLHEEEWGPDTIRPRTDSVPSLDEREPAPDASQLRQQTRRFDDIANSIRALNAKLHVIREEINGLTSTNTTPDVIAAMLSKHYDALGSDIRALHSDWERGHNSLLLATTDLHRSRNSSSPHSPMPMSPTSLGGTTVVDGGPAEALRLLTGDDHLSKRSSDATLFDEEVFEAIAKPKPRKRLSMTPGMTREEKIAKLAEDRKKRQTMQEQADTTTNMLRELQMVIKHRPNAHNRNPSTPVTPIGNRIATL